MKNNKGFSLVELIIVIAIMAILVGVVGTQVIPYIEKSRQAKDIQIMGGICTATLAAYSHEAAHLESDKNYGVEITASGYQDISGYEVTPQVVKDSMKSLTKYNDFNQVKADFSSAAADEITSIKVYYRTSGSNVVVEPVLSTYTGKAVAVFGKISSN